MEKIAVGITTHNRREVFEETLKEWQKYLPSNGVIFVVDDASKEPVKSDFRFEGNVGIAKAKNKCLELAESFDHIFLVDDDVRPKKVDWFKPYIESNVNHLCLTFDKKSNGKVYSPSIRCDAEISGLMSYTAPNGCMLYLRKECLAIAGGMRPEFGLWGFEHVEYSQRIHNLGLTPKPFMDVKNSMDLFDVLDWRYAVTSSLTIEERRTSGQKNLKIYEKFMHSAEFVPYK
jgi:glycosyltransferase involved in cell wall biosynthesis